MLKTETNGGLYADAPEPDNKKIRLSKLVESDSQFADLDFSIIPNS